MADKRQRRPKPSGPVGAASGNQITITRDISGLLGVGLSDRVVEVERVEQVSKRRAVGRHIRIVLRERRVGEVIAAAVGKRLEVPVALDELQQRNVVAIVMIDFPPVEYGERISSGTRGPSPKKSIDWTKPESQ